MHNYTLVVVDSEGNRTIQTSQATGDIVNISISGLLENTCLGYHVLATNQFGDSKPSVAVYVCKCIECYSSLKLIPCGKKLFFHVVAAVVNENTP